MGPALAIGNTFKHGLLTQVIEERLWGATNVMQKTSLKEASSLASGLIESIRIDLRREEVRLEEEMRDRVNAVQSVLSDVASIQDAIIAGSIETRRELNKAKKRLVKSGDREQMKVQILSTAGRLGELRTLHKDAVSRLQGALARPPSAVDIIERMTRDLLKMSGSPGSRC